LPERSTVKSTRGGVSHHFNRKNKKKKGAGGGGQDPLTQEGLFCVQKKPFFVVGKEIKVKSLPKEGNWVCAGRKNGGEKPPAKGSSKRKAPLQNREKRRRPLPWGSLESKRGRGEPFAGAKGAPRKGKRTKAGEGGRKRGKDDHPATKKEEKDSRNSMGGGGLVEWEKGPLLGVEGGSLYPRSLYEPLERGGEKRLSKRKEGLPL